MCIRIIQNKVTLFDLLRNNEIISYINYYNVFSDDLVSFCDNMYFHVDSSFLSRKIGVERLNGDFSGFIDELFSNYDSIFFIGGSEYENSKFLDLISSKYPNILIDGTQGYDLDIDSLKSYVLNFDLIIISAGFPLQEKLAQTLHSGNSILCTGAFISQYCSGDYYPDFYKKYNLRFLYRLFNEKSAREKFLKIVRNFIFVNFGFVKFYFVRVQQSNSLKEIYIGKPMEPSN